MNPQQQRELFDIIRSNLNAFYANPESFVPFGTEGLSAYALKIFDAEMDRTYAQYENAK